ncbi:PTS sugar transporter subunit IIA [Pectobacterium sp. B1J-3]|uniref:PTS sugar transporter subunit IIA n=1 Tax=Pectobacterium sp. B1J-3 TaxID=3385371 RepID=UPI003905BC58
MTTTVPTQLLPRILLLTHGGWGQPLCNSLRMVTGEIEGVTEIALMPVDTLGEFYQRVESVVQTMPEGSLILTDFVGGTTSNVAARLSADYPVAVVSGLNASLLLEALDRREHGRLTDCVSDLVEAGRSSCLDVVAHVHQLQQSQ